MTKSKAQKAASAKWDQINMTHLACKVTKEKAERFKEACKKFNTNPNAVFLKVVNETIKSAEGQEES